MNKRGFLLAEETLKVILAVIAIGFLAYLLFSIYGASKNSKDLALAEESLDFLQQEMNAKRATIEIYNPEGWAIGTWPHVTQTGIIFKKIETQYPLSCSNLGWNKCICICEEDSAESCDEGGICANNDGNFEINGGSIEIENPPIRLSINYENKMISKV